MDTLAFNDSALSPKQTGNDSKVKTMGKIEDDQAGSSPPHSATGHTYLATSSRSRKLACAPTGSSLPSRIPFPFKLHYMLDEVEERGIQNIVSWMPSGVAFKVHKPTKFIADVVPCYFNLTKYKSFKRQLLNYGFKRLEEKGGVRRDVLGPAFHHPHFIRDDPDSCRLIIRGETGNVNHSSPETFHSKNPIDSRPSKKGYPRLYKKGSRSLTILPSTLPPQALVTTLGEVVDHFVFGGAQSKEEAPQSICRQPPQSLTPPSDIFFGLDLHQYLDGATSLPHSRSALVQFLVHSMLQGGVKAETIEWIFSGAVSLPDLKCVLETYSGGCSSSEGAKSPQPLRNQNAPLRAKQRDLPYIEDIISLVGNATSG